MVSDDNSFLKFGLLKSMTIDRFPYFTTFKQYCCTKVILGFGYGDVMIHVVQDVIGGFVHGVPPFGNNIGTCFC